MGIDTLRCAAPEGDQLNRRLVATDPSTKMSAAGRSSTSGDLIQTWIWYSLFACNETAPVTDSPGNISMESFSSGSRSGRRSLATNERSNEGVTITSSKICRATSRYRSASSGERKRVSPLLSNPSPPDPSTGNDSAVSKCTPNRSRTVFWYSDRFNLRAVTGPANSPKSQAVARSASSTHVAILMRSASDGCGPVGGIVRFRNCIATLLQMSRLLARSPLVSAVRKRMPVEPSGPWQSWQYWTRTGRISASNVSAACIVTTAWLASSMPATTLARARVDRTTCNITLESDLVQSAGVVATPQRRVVSQSSLRRP